MLCLIFISALIYGPAALATDPQTAQGGKTPASASSDPALKAKSAELENSDQSAVVNVSINIDNPVVRVQEPVTITCTVDRDCYLNVIHLGRKGKITFLWPNQDSGWNSRAHANTPIQIPGPRSSFRLQFDGGSPEEHILALACETEGALSDSHDLKRLPGKEIKSLSKDPEDFLDDLWEKLTQTEDRAAWGAGELIIQVGAGDDRLEGRRTDMRPKVTLHAFSGVPDPSWYLTPEQEVALQKMLRSAKSLPASKSQVIPPDLGYRGFSLEGLQDPDLRGKAFVFSDTFEVEGKKTLAVKGDFGLERWLLETAGDALRPETKSYVLGLISASREPAPEISPRQGEQAPENEAEGESDAEEIVPEDLSQFERRSLTEEGLKAPYRFIMRAPRYEPQKWNQPRVRPRNNCYNYGTNRLTGTYAQPGRFSRRPILGRIYCAKVRRAVMADGLIPCGYRRRGESYEQTLPRDLIAKARTVQGHLAAVRVSPGHDYHWFRLDNNGWWSHKPGQAPATDKDRGRKISDPRYSKTYPQFCGYFFVPLHVRVKDETMAPQENK